MTYISRLSDITRSKGDPKVLRAGPSSLGSADQLARALGWFSIGLGLMELLAPRASRGPWAWRAARGWSAPSACGKSLPE